MMLGKERFSLYAQDGTHYVALTPAEAEKIMFESIKCNEGKYSTVFYFEGLDGSRLYIAAPYVYTIETTTQQPDWEFIKALEVKDDE